MATTRNLRDGRLRLVDGAGTPATLEVTLLEGDLQWTEVHNRIEVMDRGVLDHLRQGDEESVKFQYTVKYTELFNSGSGTFYEFLKQQGAYSGLTSVLSNTDVFGIDVEFYVTDPAGGTEELIKFPKAVLLQVQHTQGDEYDTVQVQMLAYVTQPTLSKTAFP